MRISAGLDKFEALLSLLIIWAWNSDSWRIEFVWLIDVLIIMPYSVLSVAGGKSLITEQLSLVYSRYSESLLHASDGNVKTYHGLLRSYGRLF